MSSETTYYAYTLNCPATGEVRYVGVSSNPDKRLREHLCDSANTFKAQWIRRLLKQALEPTMRVIESFPESVWHEKEISWIAHYKAIGAELTNSTDGGKGCLNSRTQKPADKGMRRVRSSIVAQRMGLSIRQIPRLCASGKLPPPYVAKRPHATGHWQIMEPIPETITVKKP